MGDLTLQRNASGQNFNVQLVQPDGTAVTTGTVTVQVSKDGGAMATIGGTTLHQANGSWRISLNSGDTDFLRGAYSITEASAVPVTINASTAWETVKQVSGSVGSVAGNVDGNVSGSVGSVTGNVNGSVAGSVNQVLQGVTISSTSEISLSNTLLDLGDGIESGLTLRQGLRLSCASVAFKMQDATTANPRARDYNDTKDRITWTTDGNGNRNTVVFDLS